MFKDSRIYIAGHTGLLGSALLGRLRRDGCCNLVTRTHTELDLTDRRAVFDFFSAETPEYVFLCAGRVGGIMSNKTCPADYLHVNIAIQDSVFEAALHHNAKHVVFYGSSCMYPKHSRQPMKEQYLMAGPVEPTSEAYAAAKTAGVVACKAYNQQYGANRFIALVPNSLYGPNDNFDLEHCHVLSALIRRLHEAKVAGAGSVTLWGSGTPRREFVFCDDAADASIFAVQHADRLENRHYNVGSGRDYSIRELAGLIAGIVGYEGDIHWDTTRPDGAARKLLDSSNFRRLGWQPATQIEEGLKRTYRWYQQQVETAAKQSIVSKG